MNIRKVFGSFVCDVGGGCKISEEDFDYTLKHGEMESECPRCGYPYTLKRGNWYKGAFDPNPELQYDDGETVTIIRDRA